MYGSLQGSGTVRALAIRSASTGIQRLSASRGLAEERDRLVEVGPSFCTIAEM